MRFSDPVSLPRRHPLLATALLLFTAALAHAQNFTSIVVFGDSLSDTGNDNALALAKYNLPIAEPFADYTYGRFTDGLDTLPAAHAFTGVWIEQLAAMLPANPPVKASLSGGTNYSYGFAFTGQGTTPLTVGPLFITVNNIGQQITTYLATHPMINKNTLFVLWGGANNLLNASSLGDVSNAALDELADIQRLINAGATQFLVLNLPPLGATPRLAGTLGYLPATFATIIFNDTLALGLDILPIINFFRPIHFYQLDIFSLFQTVITSPSSYGFANVTTASQNMPLLNGLPLNPDTFLFWDDLHPTTHGHNQIALAALKLIAPELSLGK